MDLAYLFRHLGFDMPLPDFTPEEQYLISQVKATPLNGRTDNSYMWGYIIGSLVVASFAAYFESIPMLLSAFVMLCAFRLNEAWYGNKWSGHWRSMIEKYEQAIENARTT